MGTSNSLDKDNEMNTSLINESAIINTEKGDIILSKTTKTSLQIESSIRNKENPDITLSPSKNDQSKDPNPNEKNAVTNQSSSLKENTDVVSISSEAAKKSIDSDPLLKSTNNSSQTKFASDPSIKICPNPSFVSNEDNDTLPPSPKSNKLNILKIKNDIKLTLKSKDISLSNKGSKDDEIQMDSQKASDTSKSQSTSNSLDKDNEMNTSLITESAIINTEKADIILSKTTKTSLQIESSIRNKEKPDITLSPSKNDQSNNPNPNEKNASINQSSSLKENTDVVSTSSEAAKKSIVS